MNREKKTLAASSAILCLIIAGLVLLLASRLPAQTSSPEDGIRATSVLPAEAYTFKFQSAGSVDNHGDYSASIPLMTVPGRGMDYPISANYKSGITTDARASWAGLGWNVNPGSVTRVINGIPDNISRCVISQANGYITENGAIVHYPPSATMSYNRPIQDDFDYFLVNIPGAVSGLVVPVNVNGDSIADYVFEENHGFIVQFGMRTFTRLISEVTPSSTTNDYIDIGYIYVTGPDGTRYIFSLPLRSEMIMHGGVAEFGGSVHFDPRFIVEYVSSWQLTAIIGPNAYASYQYPTGDMLIDENTGSWVRFEYNYPYNGNSAQVRNIRPLYFDRQTAQESNSKDPFGLLTQTAYLWRVITPTHEADFGVSPRLDISFLSPYPASPYGGSNKSGIIGDYTASPTSLSGTFIKPLRLDSITLYQRSPRARVSYVKFNYAAQGSELCRYGITLGGQTLTTGILTSVPTGSGSQSLVGIGKTTLKEIMIADSTIGYFYRFKYTDEIDGFNPPYMVDGLDQNGLGPIQGIARHSSYVLLDNYHRARTGRMGYLYATDSELSGYSPSIRNTHGAAAWSLRTIEYPTGAIDTIHYEKDSCNLAQDLAQNPVTILSTVIAWKDSIYQNGHWVYNHHLDTSTVGTPSSTWSQNLAPDELGLRVNRIGEYDPITQSSRVTMYAYTGGHLPGLPINFLRNSNSHTGVNNFRSFLFGYNGSDVEYSSVITMNQDGSRSETVYSSVESNPASYDKQYTQKNFILAQSNSALRGKTLVNTGFDDQGLLRSRAVNIWNFQLEYSGYHEVVNGFPTGMVFYYAGGKRLLNAYKISKITDSTYQYEKDLNNPGGPFQAQILTHNYAYDGYNQLSEETVKFPGHNVRTEYWRAYASGTPAGNGMMAKHMVSQLWTKRIKRIGFDNQNQILLSHVAASWAKYGVNNYYIENIDEWNDVNDNGVMDDAYGISEMITTKKVLQYDNYGNPLAMSDAHGIVTYFTWDAAYKGSRLTKTSTTVDGVTYTKKYTYNLNYQPTVIEDENGMKTSYFYDGLGRLKKVVDPNNLTLKNYEYNFKNQSSINWDGGN